MQIRDNKSVSFIGWYRIKWINMCDTIELVASRVVEMLVLLLVSLEEGNRLGTAEVVLAGPQ